MKFFPTIAEINEVISKMPPEWYYQNLEINKPTEQEQNELNEILYELTKEWEG